MKPLIQIALASWLAFCLTTAHAAESATGGTTFKVLSNLPTQGENNYYTVSKAPLLPTPLIRMPVGTVKPEGWVRQQLELLADGMIGRLGEISQWLTFEGNAWTDAQGHGKYGWEELPYWLKGFIDLGYVLKDERIIKEANHWVETIMAGQRPDGYFGDEKNRESHDLWPHMAMLYAMRTHYEATGNPRVLDFLTKYFKYQAGLPLENFLPGSWQKTRGGDNLESIYWLYNHTGASWLLDLARINHELTDPWSQTVANWHGVNFAQCFREPGQYYLQSHDPRHLKAAYRNLATMVGIYGQVPGGLFGADENARPGYIGPRQGTETCTMVEMMYSAEYLLAISGDTSWADLCENVAFNSLPASMTPDLKGLHYLTAPNQVQLDRRDKSPLIQNGGDMFSYTPYEQYRCCQHNVSHGWPYYSEHLWMATPGNGLAASLYAPCSMTAKAGDGATVTIHEETKYPFDQDIQFKLTLDKPARFPLYFRIPGWCSIALLEVNGKASGQQAAPGSWLVAEREWTTGDTIHLILPMQITAKVWEKNGNTVSISRGPLTYSLKIDEEWRTYDNKKPWKAFEVFPKSAWNYGLVVDLKDPKSSFQYVGSTSAIPAQPFTPSDAPVSLKAKARKIPQWQLEANGMVGQIRQSPVASTEPEEEVTLIPMGCARLRIAAFPIIDPAARKWSETVQQSDVLVTASVVGASDTLAALNDGIIPKTSGEDKTPRFTWWENRGSGQWVEYSFPQPRKLSSSEVMWFDDSGRGGCRVPDRWQLLYKDGNTWKEVPHPSKYGTAKDQLNRVTFDAITTEHIRLFAQFRPDYSAGIMEWRVAE